MDSKSREILGLGRSGGIEVVYRGFAGAFDGD